MLTMKNQESGHIECRICHSRTTRDLILSPCLCKGTMAYVHYMCLERWLNYSSRDKCELCSCQFNVVQNRRYTCLESMRVWFRHPANRTFIVCDLVIGLVLTTITLALICTCILGVNHFIEEGYSKGVPTFWSESIVNLFLVIVLAGYLATMYSMAKDHIRPWYAWWIHCNNIKLVLDKNVVSVLPPFNVQNENPSSACKTASKLKTTEKESRSNLLKNVNPIQNSLAEVEIIQTMYNADNTNLSVINHSPFDRSRCREATPTTSEEETNIINMKS